MLKTLSLACFLAFVIAAEIGAELTWESAGFLRGDFKNDGKTGIGNEFRTNKAISSKKDRLPPTTRLVPVVLGDGRPGASDGHSANYSLPTETLLAQVRRRASLHKHLWVEPAWDGSPRAFLLRGLMSGNEVAQLMGIARKGVSSNIESVGMHIGMIPLNKAPELNASAILRSLDERLAVLAGQPLQHIEEGYISIYEAGYSGDSLHLDNHHALFDPLRVASFVIYISGEESGLVGGGTVFPLAPRGESDLPSLREIPEKMISTWDSVLDEAYTKGKNPQGARVCPMGEVSALFGGTYPCPATLELAKGLCTAAAVAMPPRESSASSQQRVVRARAGDAVMFFHEANDGGPLTARALHGACSVVKGTKRVLAKFVRSGPRPFYSEAAFVKALISWNKAEPKKGARGPKYSQIRRRKKKWAR